MNAVATIKDVARVSGVSAMTVTRAFRNDALVSPITRQKVLMAADELRYRPNLNARVLRGGSGRSVGILLSNPTGSSVVRRLSEQLLPEKYATYIADSLGDLNIIKSVMQEFENRRVDAIVMEWRQDFYPLISMIEKLKNLILFTREDDVDCECDCCFNDHKPAVREAVGHLLRQGRKKIYFIGREEMIHTRITKKVLGEYGLEWRHIETSGYPGKPVFLNYAEALNDKLAAGIRPDAIFTLSDAAAAQLCRCASGFGMKVPEDIAVIGWGNSELSMFIQPPLASIDANDGEVGKNVRDLLFNRLQTPDSPKRQCRVEARFIHRESAG